MTVPVSILTIWLVAILGVGSIVLLIKFVDSREKKNTSAGGDPPPNKT